MLDNRSRPDATPNTILCSPAGGALSSSDAWCRTWSGTGDDPLRPACRAYHELRDTVLQGDPLYDHHGSVQSSAPAGCVPHQECKRSPRSDSSGEHVRPYEAPSSASLVLSCRHACRRRGAVGTHRVLVNHSCSSVVSVLFGRAD